MPIANRPDGTIAPGRPGNLTPEQDAKLRELWYKMGELIGLDVEQYAASLDFPNDDAASLAPSSIRKKSRFGRLGRKEKVSDNDKHGSNKEFRHAVADLSHAELREALWDFAKCDDPDANLCRYLRARKWVVQDALVMLVSTIYWRRKGMRLDDDVMLHGEEAAVRAARGEVDEGTGDLSPKMAHDMLDQLRLGKSFVHGVDKAGRPMCFIRVKLHHGGEHSPESLERLTVYMIETARFMLDPPKLETAALVFDMSGFSLANMDYTPLKFIIKVFEANYPESLGVVLVHRAPWVFQSVWGVIKGWLDPVVASKINFTKDISDLEKYVDRQNIPADMGGDEDWSYEYPEPVEGENARLADHATRDKLLAERKGLLDQFEAATMEWVVKGGHNDSEQRAARARISRALYANYWQVDPYVRSRSMYDRLGMIGPKGEFNPYPTGQASSGRAAAALDDGDTATLRGVDKMTNGHAGDGAVDTHVNGSANGVGVNGVVSGPAPIAAYSAVNSKPFQKSVKPSGAGQDSDARSIRSVESVYFDAVSEGN